MERNEDIDALIQPLKELTTTLHEIQDEINVTENDSKSTEK